MANNQLDLGEVAWNIINDPNTVLQKLPSEEKNRIIIPAGKFQLIYPLGTYSDLNVAVNYNPIAPVTLQQLLRTIYDFYQGPITPEDIDGIKETEDQEDIDAIGTFPDNKLANLLFSNISLDAIEQVENNQYQVIISSIFAPFPEDLE